MSLRLYFGSNAPSRVGYTSPHIPNVLPVVRAGGFLVFLTRLSNLARRSTRCTSHRFLFRSGTFSLWCSAVRILQITVGPPRTHIALRLTVLVGYLCGISFHPFLSLPRNGPRGAQMCLGLVLSGSLPRRLRRRRIPFLSLIHI